MDREQWQKLYGAGAGAGQQPPPVPQGSNFQYPLPTAYCAPVYMYPVPTPVKNKKMGVNDWLSDAPMPFDEFPPSGAPGPSPPNSSSTPMETGSSPMDRTPLIPVHGDTTTITQIKAEAHSSGKPSPSNDTSSNITTLELLNLDTQEKEVFPPECTLIEVYSNTGKRPVTNQVQDVGRQWCSVYYFEYGHKIGREFDAFEPNFTIDGTPGYGNSSRLALWTKPTPSSTSTVSKSSIIRNQISQGIRLTNHNGIVWLTVLSDQMFFVQGSFRNHVQNVPDHTVVRLQNKKPTRDENRQWTTPEPESIQLFDLARFNVERDALVASNRPGSEIAERLNNFCSVRVSFIKGFGENYNNRRLTECPCWVELHFTQSLNELDTYLRTHDCGPGEMNSNS